MNAARLNVAARVNPVFESVSRPEVAATLAGSGAVHLQQQALRAISVGNQPGGQLYFTGANYLGGAAAGLLTARAINPVP